MSPQNKAAWIKTPKTPLVIDEAPYLQPGDYELVIKNKAVAINPIDWVIQKMDVFPGQKYPALVGCDIAGEVVEVGAKIARFQVGDRVLSAAQALDKNNGSFQLYPLVDEITAVKIPDNVSFEEATSLPLGFLTAACVLYNTLDLNRPKVNPVPSNEIVIVWGASSSVGMNAVQLAKGSGYKVIATCGPHNFDIIKKLGADHVLDYKSSTLEQDLMNLLKGKRLAGTADCGSRDGGTHPVCTKVVAAVEGNKLVGCALMNQNKLPDGVTAEWKNADIVRFTPVAKAIFEDFLEPALQQGKFIPAPEPMVVGTGLESLSEAFEIQAKGVSAKKVVITL